MLDVQRALDQVWPKALTGDPQAIEWARRLLELQAKALGLVGR